MKRKKKKWRWRLVAELGCRAKKKTERRGNRSLGPTWVTKTSLIFDKKE